MSTPKNSNANDCITSCCVFNYYTQSPVYNPNPTRLWSRFNYVCPCSPDQPSCSTDYDKLDERRKAEIFKYKANSSNITKKQQYANAASNRWLTGRKRGWATQTDTFTNPNTSTLKQVGNVLECTNNNVSSSLTSDSDVPGKVQKLSYNPSVPLYNYKVTRTYTDGGGKYGLYGRVENPSLSNFNNITTTVYDVFNLTPPTSNSAGAFTYTSSNLLVATISGITVTAISVGFCTITATQAAYSNYRPGSITALLTVNKKSPTITNFSIPTQTYQTNASYDLSLTPPTSNSAGAFTYTSSNLLVATISGITVTAISVGFCTITATQAAYSNYRPGSITALLTVNKKSPTITNFSIPTQTYQTNALYDLSLTPPTSDSAGAFTYTSSNSTVATIAGNILTIAGASVLLPLPTNGPCTITATQAETPTYASGSISTSLIVNKFNTLLGVPGLSPQPAIYQTNPSFTIATSTNRIPPLATPIIYASGNTSVATITGSTGGAIHNAGSSVISATQAETPNYTLGSNNNTLNVNTFPTHLNTFNVPSPKIVGDSTFILTHPTSDRDSPYTNTDFSYTSNNNAVATVHSLTGLVTINAAGSCTITAYQAAIPNKYDAAQISATLVVNGTTSTVFDWNSISTTPPGNTYTFAMSPVTYSINDVLTITYSASDTITGTIASIDTPNNTVTLNVTAFTSATYTPVAQITGVAPIGISGSQISPVLNFFPTTTTPSNGIIPAKTIITTGVVYVYYASPSTPTFTMRINGTGVVERADADPVVPPAYPGGIPAPTSVTWQGANGGCFVADSQAPVIQAVTIAPGRVDFGYPNGAPFTPPYFAGVIAGYQVPYSSGLVVKNP